MRDNYGIEDQRGSSQRHDFFDFKRGLRPRILHRKNQHAKGERVNTEPLSLSSEQRPPRLSELGTIHRLSEREHSYLFRSPKPEPTLRLPTLRTRHASSKETLT